MRHRSAPEAAQTRHVHSQNYLVYPHWVASSSNETTKRTKGPVLKKTPSKNVCRQEDQMIHHTHFESPTLPHLRHRPHTHFSNH
ncbi:hypothetical protein SERLADRAFT_480147 [Serpula lacrymans var. lacrymans S7.9]|uniref:Uncharacterized protein n=1 Tax=Serpula lacrymans var. lacrymans (strain S7.9) TaxID=578457 RepID=F8PCR3_SERL9|nr:uncharacterized protein SERLADRAFT_480147 [Serpula lacrymans var. lacrymans S7.9]EGO19012.1 hypothetical protein SERLADRAFT_480147 [Serpula lacrymans var. lacrymans S7.9]